MGLLMSGLPCPLTAWKLRVRGGVRRDMKALRRANVLQEEGQV